MGTWEYRVVERVASHPHMDDSIWYEIIEVYYDDAGKIVGASDKPIAPMGDSLLDLCADFDLIAKAFNKPVLDYETMKEVKETKGFTNESDELKIKTHYQFGFPYHTILCGNMVVVNLAEKNYKLANKIKKLLSENPDIIFRSEKI